jgi:hypothetical protein
VFQGAFCDIVDGDLDGDGHVDLVLAAYAPDGNADQKKNQVLMGSTGAFTLSDRLPADDLITRAASLCDVDSDGDLDVLLASTGTTLPGVPTLLLQPLVENAILHGIQPSMYGGTVRIGARRSAGWLELEVDDDGMGLPAENGNGRRERVGLTNSRERLEMQFGDEQSLHIAPRDPSGTRVSIRIPWSTEEAADGAAG